MIKFSQDQGGSSSSRQHFNENLETLRLAPTLFYHLPGFYLTTGFLNPHTICLSQDKCQKFNYLQYDISKAFDF